MAGLSESMIARARAAVESLYSGLCDVYEYTETADAETHIVKKERIRLYTDIPCRLSFESLNATSESETVSTRRLATKLFLAPEIEIKAGSLIIVTQSGATKAYAASGEPAVHEYHQEIMLELLEDKA